MSSPDFWCGRAVQLTPEFFGEHCLSEASCAAAGVCEPHRDPAGPHHGGNGFGSFCRNKRTSSVEANPDPKKYSIALIFLLGYDDFIL